MRFKVKRPNMGDDLIKSRTGLVKVTVQVNGKTGPYQATRWKRPDEIKGMLTQQVKSAGIPLDAKLKHNKTGETFTMEQVIEKFSKNPPNIEFTKYVSANFAPKNGVNGGGNGYKDNEGRGDDSLEEIEKNLNKMIEATETNTSDADIDDCLSKHTGKDGKLTPERERLHREIIKSFFKGKKPVNGQATYVIMGGGPASGKSTVIKSGLIKVPEGSVEIDGDEIKGMLPEYEEMINSGDEDAARYAHEESSALTKRIQKIALTMNYNTLLDGTGDGSSKSLGGKIKQARESGYRVVGEYVTTDTEEAVRRAVSRGERSGRVVDEVIIRETHKNVTLRAVEYAKQFDEMRIYENTSEPVLIASGGSGRKLRAAMGQEGALQRFLRKGNE